MSNPQEIEQLAGSPSRELEFLAGGGEMGEIMRTKDWGGSPLGDPETWPRALRVAVRLLLNTKHPFYIFWGPEGACLYNDAYRQSIGPERHPHSIGRPAREVWEEIWDIIGPQIEQVMAGGEATWHENQLVPITRNGRREDVYWTYSYGPIDDQSAPNGVGGVLVVCTETTEAVLMQQRQSFQIELDMALRGVGDPIEVMAVAARLLGTRLSVDRCGYGEVDESGCFVTVAADWTAGRMPGLTGRLKLNDFGPALVQELECGRTIRLADTLTDARTQGAADAYAAVGNLRAAMAAPLIEDEKLAAAIYVHCAEPRFWTDMDESLVELVAKHTWDAVKRARAESALRASETELRFALNAGRLGAWSLDLATGSLNNTIAFRANFGLGRNDTLSKAAMLEALHPDDRPRFDEALEQSTRSGDDFDIECRTLAADGRQRWINIRGQPSFDPYGQPLRIAGVSLDITDRMAEEDRNHALIKLTDRLRDIDDPAGLAYAACETLGLTLGVSRVGYGFIDAGLESITIEREWHAEGVDTLAGQHNFRDYGTYIEDLKRGETVVVVDAEIDVRTRETAEALKAVKAQSFVNLPITERNGRVTLLYLTHETARPWPDEELAFIRDVTERTRMVIERRRAELELRDSNERLERIVDDRTAELQASQAQLRTIFETSVLHQAVLALDGTLLDANATSLASIDASLEDVVGKPYWQTPWFTDTPGMPDAVRQAVSTVGAGETVRREIQVNLPSGKRWFDFVMRPMRDDHGQIVNIVPEAVETTQRHEAEEQLRQAQKMEAVGNLTGGVAHDFNNLLQVIGSNLQLLSKGIEEETDRQHLRNALEGVRRGSDLASQLLVFGRRQVLKPKVVSLGRLIHGLDDMLRRALGEGVEIGTEVPDDLWNVHVDPSQVETAILNLAINGRDAMEGHGRLSIETRNVSFDESDASHQLDFAAGQYVMLAVTDTGSGMSAEVIDRAFEPFFSTKPEGQGTGLGLSMVWGLVKQSQGHIRIYSEPGQGTTIRIYLPRVSQEEDPLVASDDGPVTGGDETVLLVEDDEKVRESVSALLADLGYGVLTAENAEIALSIVDSDAPIDLLFTDVVMPGSLRSTELAKQAKQRRPSLAVLFTSGYAENAIAHGGRLEEGIELLSKPYSQETLARKVREVLDRAAGDRNASPAESSTSYNEEAPEADGLRILVVEDDPMVRESTSALLLGLGHRAIAAANGAEALSALDSGSFDVLMTDLNLPDTTGMELAAEARKRRPGLRVIVASGAGQLSEDNDPDHSSDLTFLPKPYDDDALQAALTGASGTSLA